MRNMKKTHALMKCPVCGAVMQKKDTESWPTYFMRTACSASHAAILRRQKERDKEAAIRALESVIWNWRIA